MARIGRTAHNYLNLLGNREYVYFGIYAIRLVLLDFADVRHRPMWSQKSQGGATNRKIEQQIVQVECDDSCVESLRDADTKLWTNWEIRCNWLIQRLINCNWLTQDMWCQISSTVVQNYQVRRIVATPRKLKVEITYCYSSRHQRVIQ